MPVELVTPTVIGSPSTHSNGTTIVLERRRPSVVGPSTVKGTIASSTFTFAIVRSSVCGFRTRMRISPGENSTRRMSNSSAAGGFEPTRSTERRTRCHDDADCEREQENRHDRPQPPVEPAVRARRRAGLHQSSTTSKKPIQPSSANSDWCAWNMCSPVPANWISSTPRWPWHCMTVSVYSQCSPVPVGW